MDTAIAPILPTQNREKRLNLFERYLTVWVGLCMVAGIVFGQSAPATVQFLRSMEFGQGSHVNFPMVFVWSYLTDGDPAYTLVQVSVNDLIMLVLFAPLVAFLVSGASSLHVPYGVLLYSVMLSVCAACNRTRDWFAAEAAR